jgi:hypothetical protein
VLVAVLGGTAGSERAGGDGVSGATGIAPRLDPTNSNGVTTTARTREATAEADRGREADRGAGSVAMRGIGRSFL